MLQFVLGCRHHQRSAVFTINQRTYQVCLKCGQEFEYSWALMHSVRSSVGVKALADQARNSVR